MELEILKDSPKGSSFVLYLSHVFFKSYPICLNSLQAFDIPLYLMVEISANNRDIIHLTNPIGFSDPSAAGAQETRINAELDPEIVELITSPHTFEIYAHYSFKIDGRDELAISIGTNHMSFSVPAMHYDILIQPQNRGMWTSSAERHLQPGSQTIEQLHTGNHSITSIITAITDHDMIPHIEAMVIDEHKIDHPINTIENLQQLIRDYADAPEIIDYLISNFVDKTIFPPITSIASLRSFVESLANNPIIIASALRLIRPVFLQDMANIQKLIAVMQVLPQHATVFKSFYIQTIIFNRNDSVEDLIELIRLMPRDAEIFSQFLNKVMKYAAKDISLKDEFRHPIDTLSSGWGDCDDYVVLNYFWAYLQGYKPYIVNLNPKESSEGGHVYTWFKNEQNRIVVLDNNTYKLLNQDQTIEHDVATRYKNMVLVDAYIRIK